MLACTLAEGFWADVKADFLTAGSAWLRRRSPRPSSLDGMLRLSFGQDEPAGRGLGPRQEPNPQPEGSCNATTTVGCPKAPHVPCLHKIPVCQALRSCRLGQKHPLPWGGCPGWTPGCSRLVNWRSLRKGKLRQHEMLWMHHPASGGRNCSECPGWGSSAWCQLMATGG